MAEDPKYLPHSPTNAEGWLPEETASGDKQTGPLVLAAMLRGNPQASLRHRLAEIKGTAWGRIASMMSGTTNGATGEKLIAACQGVRFAGMDQDQSVRYVLGLVARYDELVVDWLAQDSEFKRRSALPRRNLEEVAGMFDEIEWLWDGWIPRGYVSMIVGRPGAGKSYVAAWLATNAILGGKFPDGQESGLDRETSEIMWIDTEASQQMMLSRLRTMAGPRSRFFWPLNPKDPDQHFPLVNLTNPMWAELIFDMAMTAKPAWIWIDSLRGAHSSDENSSDMQAVLANAANIARDLNCAFSFVHHLRKQAPGESNEVTLDMVRGSSGIVAVPRVVIAIDQPDPTRAEKRMRVIKSNLAEIPEAVGISIDERGPMIVGDVPAVPRRVSALDKAKEFILARLRLGPAPSQEIIADGEAHGISLRSMRRACEELGIVTTKTRGTPAYWQWALPAHESQQEAPPF